MRIHWRFRDGIEPDDKAIRKAVVEYFEKKLPRIGRLLVWYEPDQQQLSLTMSRTRGLFAARAVLWLPTGTIVAEGEGATPTAAIDDMVDTFVREIRRHRELVRKDYLFRRKRYRARELGAAEPYLRKDVEQEKREAFFDLLRPLLRRVRKYAERELRILELEGTVSQGEITANDLVDEVIATAWERFPEKPSEKPLEVWLVQLLHEKLKDLTKRPEKIVLANETSKQEEHLIPEEDLTERSYWLERLFESPERVTLEDLMPDYESTEVWESLTGEEQREQLEEALSQLPTEERQALLLSALEGYEPREIAMIQDVAEDEVRKRIESARNKLADRLGVERKCD